jgi:NADH-quinone oxidoreductase subunit N
MLQIFLLTGLGILAMLSEVFNFKKAMPYIAKLTAVLAAGASIVHWGENHQWFGNMLQDDNFAQGFIFITSILFGIWLIISNDLFDNEDTIPDYISLASFAMVGGYMIVSFTNLAILFLGIEILSIPVYVLAGSNRKNLKSNESAFKYFLMGAFASGILLFGMTFIYGATGSFNTNTIGQVFSNGKLASTSFFHVGILMVIFAMAFKISAVPFHFWTPDVYEGAPNKITAFMASLVKAFAVAAMFRLISHLLNGNTEYIIGLSGIAALTMIVGNLLGAVQDNPKRLLAFSSVGHAGFLLIPILVNSSDSSATLLYYSFAYGLSTLLAFFILDKVLVKNDFYWSVGDFSGLIKRNSTLAVGMTIALLSMAGIPPLSGFFAKYFVFLDAFKNGYSWLVICAIIASLIGIFYYFRFIISMFNGKLDKDMSEHIEISNSDKYIIIFISVLIIGLGIFPDYIIGLLK